MADPHRLTVAPEAAGMRLDRWVTDHLEDVTRNKVGHAFEDGRLTVNGVVPTKLGAKVSAGDVVVYVPLVVAASDAPVAESLPLVIVYEDDDVCVVDKAPGMVVHPAPGHPGGTLVNALMHHLGDSLSAGFERGRPGIVHRIDRDTSGLLVVAKNDVAQTKLGAQFAAHTVHRRYRAVVYGTALADTGTIETRFNRHHANRKKMTGRTHKGRRAVTHWEILARCEALSLVQLALETGRTHQIRVHLSERGYPIVADPIYGMKKPPSGGGGELAQELAAARRMPRLALHAAELGFEHPTSGAHVRWVSPDPPDLAELVAVVTGA